MKVPASARSTRLRKGDPWLKTLLVQCAWAGRRKKGSYFNAQFYRLSGRRGPKKAACAVAASLLTTIYHMLNDGTQFQDLGADHFDRRSKEGRAKRLVTQLAKLGFDATLTPFPRAAWRSTPMSRTKITLLMPCAAPVATPGVFGAFRAHPVSSERPDRRQRQTRRSGCLQVERSRKARLDRTWSAITAIIVS
jgi:hypothetical protein